MKYLESKEQIPRFVYKYFSNLKYAMAVIRDQKIHFESPQNYNDVFDCSFALKKEKIPIWNQKNVDRIEFIIDEKFVKERQIVSKIPKESFENCSSLYEVYNKLQENGISKEVIEESKKIFDIEDINFKPMDLKMSCFSEINDSLLMWAHYGAHLTGCCLCFDTSLDRELFSNLHKINYTKFRKDFGEVGYNGVIFEKSLDWAYEQEWRLITRDKNIEFIDTKSCVGLILGENIEFRTDNLGIPIAIRRNYQTLIKQAKLKKLKIWQAKADINEFKINIVNMNKKEI